MTADVLRSAAALMRERAEAAKGGEWEFGEERGALMTEWAIFSPDAGHDFAMCEDPADAEHIASWHPAVALAVAEWLETTARWWDQPSATPGMRSSAVAVARAYLNAL